MPPTSDAEIVSKTKQVVKTAYRVEKKLHDLEAGQPESSNRRTITEADYADVEAKLHAALAPNPSHPEEMAQLIKTARLSGDGIGAGEVSAVADLESTFGQKGSEWHGEAAINFDKFFLRPFDTCVKSQQRVLGDLESAMLTLADILDKRRADYVESAKKTIDVLEAILECDWADVEVALKLVGVGIAVAAAVPTGGASIGGLAVLAAGHAALSTAVEIKVKEDGNALTISGPQPIDALESLGRVLGKIDTIADDKAGALASLVAKSSNNMTKKVNSETGSENVPELLPHEPKQSGVGQITDGDGDKIADDIYRPN